MVALSLSSPSVYTCTFPLTSSNYSIFLLLEIIFCFFPVVHFLSHPCKCGLIRFFFFFCPVALQASISQAHLPGAMATSQALSWLLCRGVCYWLSHPTVQTSSLGFWNTLLLSFLAIFPHSLWLAHRHLLTVASSPHLSPWSYVVRYADHPLLVPTRQTFPLNLWTSGPYVQPSTEQASSGMWQRPQTQQAWNWAAALLK